MISNWDKSLALVLKSEGGYVNNPADPGGMTNLGVTKNVWEEWVGHPIDEKIMRELTPERVAPLYKRKYWDACNCDNLPLGIDYLVFDFAVNAGVGRSAKTLQTAIGCVPDGVIGVNTMAAINKAEPKSLIDKFATAKTNFYQSLKTFPIFGKGWLRRVDETKKNALEMLA